MAASDACIGKSRSGATSLAPPVNVIIPEAMCRNDFCSSLNANTVEFEQVKKGGFHEWL